MKIAFDVKKGGKLKYKNKICLWNMHAPAEIKSPLGKFSYIQAPSKPIGMLVWVIL